MAERFSQKNLRVRPSSDEEKIVTNAKKHFEKTLVAISGELVGSVAALEHPTKNTKLNYGEIFLRDNVPVMIYLITQKRYEVVKKFLSVCLELQSTNYQTRGVFPTSSPDISTNVFSKCFFAFVTIFSSSELGLTLKFF